MTRSKIRFLYLALALGALLAAVVSAEVYLASQAAPRSTLPFYNRLAPYVMFQPQAKLNYVSAETFEMSHHHSQVFHYTNEDGFRVSSPDYELPKSKPAKELRVAVIGGSAVRHGSTFEDTLPGSLKTLIQEKHPGREVEVINAGIESCVSKQSIIYLLFTVLDYEPDIVILYDGANDLGNILLYEARPNYPYNFQTMEEAWGHYRSETTTPLWELILDRSYLYSALRLRFGGADQLKTTSTIGLGLRRAPNALTSEQLLSDQGRVRTLVAAYLSNWVKLIELSKAYGFKPVCVLQPTGGLDREYAMTALPAQWVDAFTALYDEASRQMEALRGEYPEVAILNLSKHLQPAKDHFWDGVHVYDETNALIAERIYQDLGPFLRSPPQTP